MVGLTPLALLDGVTLASVMDQLEHPKVKHLVAVPGLVVVLTNQGGHSEEEDQRVDEFHPLEALVASHPILVGVPFLAK